MTSENNRQILHLQKHGVLFIGRSTTGVSGGVEKTAREIQVACVANGISFEAVDPFNILEGKLYFHLMSKVVGFNLALMICTYLDHNLKRQFYIYLGNRTILVRSIGFVPFLLTKKLTKRSVFIPSHLADEIWPPIIEREENIFKKLKCIINYYCESTIERLVYNSKIKILCFSKNFCSRIQLNYPSAKVSQAYPGVSDVFNYCPTKLTLPIQFVYVGRIEYGKNLELLLQTFQNLHPNVGVLKVIGDGSLLRKYRTKYDQSEFLGYCTPNEINDVMRQSSFLVILSKNESFGHVIAEALTSGLPVIGYDSTSSKNAISELIVHKINGLVLDNLDEPSLTSLLTLASKLSPEFHSRSSEIAFNALKKFNWLNFLAKIEDV